MTILGSLKWVICMVLDHKVDYDIPVNISLADLQDPVYRGDRAAAVRHTQQGTDRRCGSFWRTGSICIESHSVRKVPIPIRQ